jgi:hypothetical protein
MVMKLIPLAILLFGLQTASSAQPYICGAPDSVLAMYRDDADRMAIAQAYPASDRLHIDGPVPKGLIMLYGLDGRAVRTIPQYVDGIDVSGLHAGVYFLRTLERPYPAPLRFEVMH